MNSTYDYKSDVFSAGIVLYEMMFPAFSTTTERYMVLGRARQGEFQHDSETVSDAFFELVTRMMAKDPRDRPSAGEAAELAKQISEKNEHFVVKLKEDEDFGR